MWAFEFLNCLFVLYTIQTFSLKYFVILLSALGLSKELDHDASSIAIDVSGILGSLREGGDEKDVTPSTPHIYTNKGIKIQILIKSIFKTFLNTSLSKG